MMKNKIKINVFILLTFLVLSAIIFYGCKKSFLDAHPYGQYSSDQIKNKKGLTALLVGVYGVLDGQGVAGDSGRTHQLTGPPLELLLMMLIKAPMQMTSPK